MLEAVLNINKCGYRVIFRYSSENVREYMIISPDYEDVTEWLNESDFVKYHTTIFAPNSKWFVQRAKNNYP